ncbi:MAG: cytochrome c [Ichthyobacteriaceae bacterium]|nr:cytochrome c [Ichthyobacteriaceae bacterium]
MIAITIISCNSNAPKRNPADVFMPDMYKSVAYEPYSENSMLKPVLGTIKRGFMPYEIDNTLQGYNNALASLKMPIKQTAFNLKQGKELYNIYCISCHGKNGDGNGKLVLNEKILGIPEYSKTKLPNITEGSIFHVITYGKNMMGSHSSQLTATERWQIVQYVLKLRE